MQGIWPLDQLGHRHPATWRQDRGRQRTGRIHRIHDQTAASRSVLAVRGQDGSFTLGLGIRSDGKSGSHMTLRWREMDSNPRSPVRGSRLAMPSADRFDTSRRSSGAPSDLILLLFSAGGRPGDRRKKMPTSSKICPGPLAGVMRLRRGRAVLRLRWGEELRCDLYPSVTQRRACTRRMSRRLGRPTRRSPRLHHL
jgi:hypothetical protein